MFHQISWGKVNNPAEKVYFLGQHNKPPATPAAALKVKSALSFQDFSVFCYKVDVRRKS